MELDPRNPSRRTARSASRAWPMSGAENTRVCWGAAQPAAYGVSGSATHPSSPKSNWHDNPTQASTQPALATKNGHGPTTCRADASGTPVPRTSVQSAAKCGVAVRFARVRVEATRGWRRCRSVPHRPQSGTRTDSPPTATGGAAARAWWLGKGVVKCHGWGAERRWACVYTANHTGQRVIPGCGTAAQPAHRAQHLLCLI